MSKSAKRNRSKSPAPSPKSQKHVYFFGNGKADGNRHMKDVLGGKGSGLAEMTNAGLPVPPGFTISTGVCNIYYAEKGRIPAEIDREIEENLRKLEKAAGKKLGDVSNPLLVSVRSGAKFSMPGMMDTILNLGLNDQTVEGMRHCELPVFSVQYHPEASPGPHDAHYLFGQFIASMLPGQ